MMIGGRYYRKVAFLVARTIAQVVLLAAGIPTALLGIDVVIAGVGGLVEANIVEDEELRLGAEIARCSARPEFFREMPARLSWRSSEDRGRSAGG